MKISSKMSRHIPLLLLLMASPIFSSPTSQMPTCPMIDKCHCTIPRALLCSGNTSDFYQKTLDSVALLANGAVELLEIVLEGTNEIGASGSGPVRLNLPRLVVSASGGLRFVDPLAFAGMEDQLVYLGLPDSKLKSVPSDSLRRLVNLRTLDLRQNAVSELRVGDFKTLLNLTHLDLSENSLAHIPQDAFVGLYQLQELILHKNLLTKKTLIVFSELSNLRELDLSSNHIVGNVDEELMPNLPNLEKLQLQDNNMRSIRSGSLAGCPQLQTLNLSHNILDVIEDGAFLLLSELRILDLSHNEIVALSRRSMRGLAELRELRVSANHLRAVSPELVAPLRSLKELWLEGNDIARVEDGVVKVLRSFELSRLRLDGNPLECDCSMRDFAKWLRNSSLPRRDGESAVCATPSNLVGASLISTELDEFTCSEEEEEWNTESKRSNTVLPTVPGLPAITGTIQLHRYNYSANSGVVLTWRVAPGPTFTCDAVFVYESQQSGTGSEVLLGSNPVRCSKQEIDSQSDSHWRRVTVLVPGSLDLQEGGLYRYCLVLTRSLGGASDDVDFALGCSDLIQLYKNNEQIRSTDASIQFVSSAINLGGELNLHVSVRGLELASSCALGVAVLAQGSVIARRDAPCNVLVRLQGFLEGPYTVCVALSGHSVPGPHARCASVIRTVQTTSFSQRQPGLLIVLAILGSLLVTLATFVVVRLLKKQIPSYYQTYYVKLHNTTSL